MSNNEKQINKIVGMIRDALQSTADSEQNKQSLEIDFAELIEVPADIANGDLSFPCFKLSKILRKSPAAVATELQKAIKTGGEIVDCQAVNGYLNFFLSAEFYKVELTEIQSDSFGTINVGKNKTVVLDYSSPNIAKRFHVGHLGSTVIGESLKRIYNHCGYNAISINYLGDWGTSFGKLIVAYKLWSSKELVDERGIDELTDIYVKFTAEAEADPSLNDKAREAFALLERGDAESTAIWRHFNDISLAEYKKTYRLLGIEFDVYDGESFYTDKMPAVVNELREKTLLTVDDGASLIRLDDFNMPPCLILKRDGSTLYPARDIACAIWKKSHYNFDKCIYVTSAGQSLHFAQWFKVVELMGYDWVGSLVHIPYGTMSIGGEKLASRTGNVILLDELLNTAIDKAAAIMREKNPDMQNLTETSVAVGTGAIIFNTLANSRIKDTNFIWENALSFEGNSGPYMQYTYARTSSLLRKAGEVQNGFDNYIPNADEIALIKTLSLFPQKLLSALEANEPCHITRFALEVCAAFNLFYHNNNINRESGEVKSFRLILVSATRNIIGKCLDLLVMKRTEEI